MEQSTRNITIWLYSCAALVALMMIVGAITRLTESGLSMVEWRPLIGALPPLSEAEWTRVFALYQETPEYQKVNAWMGIEDFKRIFFWEWFHRVLGRLIGLAYGLPLLWFWIKKQIPQGYGLKLLGMLILGGLQGVMGWYMVQSGLVDNPAVSHYRLAAHLSLAMVIFALLLWLALSVSQSQKQESKALFVHGLVTLVFVAITIVWGAFVAGLDAGLVYNDEFPTMAGAMIPPDLWFLSPAWINLFENAVGVQFTHRWLAMTTVLVVLSFCAHACQKHIAMRLCAALACVALAQMMLGIATLLSGVWLPLATLHQAGAVCVLGVLMAVLYRVKPAPRD